MYDFDFELRVTIIVIVIVISLLLLLMLRPIIIMIIILILISISPQSYSVQWPRCVHGYFHFQRHAVLSEGIIDNNHHQSSKSYCICFVLVGKVIMKKKNDTSVIPICGSVHQIPRCKSRMGYG